MVSVDRNMWWDENKITQTLNIFISVYNQLLCWCPKYTFNTFNNRFTMPEELLNMKHAQ
jgi:hypothetical protein